MATFNIINFSDNNFFLLVYNWRGRLGWLVWVITSYDCTFIKAVSVRPAHPAPTRQAPHSPPLLHPLAKSLAKSLAKRASVQGPPLGWWWCCILCRCGGCPGPCYLHHHSRHPRGRNTRSNEPKLGNRALPSYCQLELPTKFREIFREGPY